MVSAIFPYERDMWTIEDLAAMPDDDRRYEIVDGQLVMSPRVAVGHQGAVGRLRRLLEAAFGPEFHVWENVAVNIAPTWRVPDLTVFRASAYVDADLDIRPADIPLVVEVVSPSSRTTDRITKPAEYAAAGIGAYWRFETIDGPSLTAYALAPGATTYAEVGTWTVGNTVVIDDPVPLSFVVE